MWCTRDDSNHFNKSWSDCVNHILCSNIVQCVIAYTDYMICRWRIIFRSSFVPIFLLRCRFTQLKRERQTRKESAWIIWRLRHIHLKPYSCDHKTECLHKKIVLTQNANQRWRWEEDKGNAITFNVRKEKKNNIMNKTNKKWHQINQHNNERTKKMYARARRMWMKRE